MNPTPQAYNVQETADMLGMSPSTIYRALKAGTVDPQLRPFKVGNVWRFPVTAINQVLGVTNAA